MERTSAQIQTLKVPPSQLYYLSGQFYKKNTTFYQKLSRHHVYIYIFITSSIGEHSIFTVSKNLVLHKQCIYLKNIYMHTIKACIHSYTLALRKHTIHHIYKYHVSIQSIIYTYSTWAYNPSYIHIAREHTIHHIYI